jgi:hypothetical protein
MQRGWRPLEWLVHLQRVPLDWQYRCQQCSPGQTRCYWSHQGCVACLVDDLPCTGSTLVYPPDVGKTLKALALDATVLKDSVAMGVLSKVLESDAIGREGVTIKYSSDSRLEKIIADFRFAVGERETGDYTTSLQYFRDTVEACLSGITRSELEMTLCLHTACDPLLRQILGSDLFAMRPGWRTTSRSSPAVNRVIEPHPTFRDDDDIEPGLPPSGGSLMLGLEANGEKVQQSKASREASVWYRKVASTRRTLCGLMQAVHRRWWEKPP